MKMLEHATHVRLGGAADVARLLALGGRVVASGTELHALMLDSEGRDLSPETCAALRWTLLAVGRRVRILVVQQPSQWPEAPHNI